MKDEGCDVAPITDWGGNEPEPQHRKEFYPRSQGTDTEAALATVRKALADQARDEGYSEKQIAENVWPSLAALDALAAELEQERRWAKAERSGRKQERTRADTAEAEVTRIRENFGTAARAINALQAEHEAEIAKLHISIEGAMARVVELEGEREEWHSGRKARVVDVERHVKLSSRLDRAVGALREIERGDFGLTGPAVERARAALAEIEESV